MNKQIIINGVDVTKCPFYMDCKKCTMLSYVSTCEGSCAYTEFHNLLVENEEIKKQSKRKEQEYEVLKKLAETHLAETINMQREIDLLKEELAISIQENEEGREINAELKAENEKLKNNTTSFDYLDSLTNEQVAVLYTASIDELAIRGYKAKYNTEVSLLTRYKQVLTEIKEHFNEECKLCKANYVNITDEICEECKYKEMLQKCEVLNDK